MWMDYMSTYRHCNEVTETPIIFFAEEKVVNFCRQKINLKRQTNWKFCGDHQNQNAEDEKYHYIKNWSIKNSELRLSLTSD